MGAVSSTATLGGREADAHDANALKKLLAEGRTAEARERFAAIVSRHQRRASRIAFHYLGDMAEADEAVQDAFVKAYVHLDTFREEFPFEVWFTRILVNACLDRIKARTLRSRWFLPRTEEAGDWIDVLDRTASSSPSPEDLLLADERHQRLSAALHRLPDRQRLAFVMCQIEGHSAKEVSAATGLNESTVRVHLFRAVRRLRTLLGDQAGRTEGHRAVR
jgi:RNA polymerase sigma-70 factor (ECF subfamily)